MNYNMQNQMGDKRENTHLKYLKTLGIMILAVVIVTLILPRNSIDVEVGYDALSVVCASGNLFGSRELARAEVPYDEIESMELIETAIRGEYVDGYAGRRGIGARYDAGVWSFADFGGEYDLIIREDAAVSILVKTTDGRRVVFNFESTDSTNNLYEALTVYLGR